MGTLSELVRLIDGPLSAQFPPPRYNLRDEDLVSLMEAGGTSAEALGTELINTMYISGGFAQLLTRKLTKQLMSRFCPPRKLARRPKVPRAPRKVRRAPPQRFWLSQAPKCGIASIRRR